MLSKLKSTRTLLMEPLLWHSMLEDLPAKIQAAMEKKKQCGEGEDGNRTDCYGNEMESERAIGSTLVIPVKGVICKGLPEIASECGFMRVEDLEEELFEAENDPRYTKIILDVDSPGGMVTGVPEVADMVARINQTKPVVAFTSGQMCSAAYWICAGASMIVGTKSSQSGSIGAYTAIPDLSGMWQAMGVVWQMFRSGKFKGAGAQGIGLSDDQKALIQSEVDAWANQFKAHVLTYRPLIKPEAMEGQCFIGQAAADAYLLDDVVTGMKAFI